MTIALTDLMHSIPQQPNGQAGVLDQWVPASQLATALNVTGGGPAEYAAVSSASPATLTGAEFAGADFVVINMTAALGAGGTLDTPTAANIIAAIPNPVVGLSYMLRIINTSSGNFAWTLTAGDANVTITGTKTIAQDTFRDFIVTIASATTVTIQTVGVGTFS